MIDYVALAKEYRDIGLPDETIDNLLQVPQIEPSKYLAPKDFLQGANEYAYFDLVAHLRRQIEFSRKTFGPEARAAGVLDHIQKELGEIRANPYDLSEWIDVVLLALDGAWRHGHSPEEIVQALDKKQRKNEARKWPDWRTTSPDKAIEHDRSGE